MKYAFLVGFATLALGCAVEPTLPDSEPDGVEDVDGELAELEDEAETAIAQFRGGAPCAEGGALEGSRFCERICGRLEALYKRISGPDGRVDNIMRAHSLRPHGLEGHMALYKAVLHHRGNVLERWLLETLGVYVSLLNSCSYCVEHHFEGLRRLLGDNQRADAIRQALEADEPERALEAKHCALIAYAGELTRYPAELAVQDIEALREAGWDDGVILEVNQVVSYFAYANRTVLGLGVATAGEALGLSPSDLEDESAWDHR